MKGRLTACKSFVGLQTAVYIDSNIFDGMVVAGVIREARAQSELTQSELAQLSGT